MTEENTEDQINEDVNETFSQNETKETVAEKPQKVKKVKLTPRGRPPKTVSKNPDTIRAEARARRKAKKEARERMGAIAGQKLVAPNKRGVKRRWVTDDLANIDTKLDLGYYFVQESETGDEYIPTSDLGSRKSQITGKNADGSPQRSYLMEIPEDIYQENQQENESKIRAIEDQIRRGNPDGRGLSDGSAYDPSPGKNSFNI